MENINNQKSTNQPEIIKVEAHQLQPQTSDKRPNIIIGTLNIFINPARKRYHRFYQPQNNQWWYLHLIIDSIFLIIIIILTIANIWLATYNPKQNLYPTTNRPNKTATANQSVPDLKLNLQINKKILDPGEKFEVIINYKNEGKNSAKDVILTLNLNGEFWQGKNQIIWDSSDLPQLKEIKPQEIGQIKFSGVLAKKFEPQSDSQTKFALITQLEAQYFNSSTTNNQEKITSISNKEIIKINTDFKVNAFSRYYSAEGEQLGRGPWPPIVGQTTKLWVFFNVETTYNDVSDIIITGKLANNVELTGKMSATSEKGIEFDEVNRIISWKINRLLAPSKLYPEIGVAFEVSTIPQLNQTGQITLISDIKASGKDAFTGKVFNLKIPDVTSLVSDK